MEKTTLTAAQRQIRMAVRNFLLMATKKELEQEKQISLDTGDQFRADCIQELLDEHEAEPSEFKAWRE